MNLTNLFLVAACLTSMPAEAFSVELCVNVMPSFSDNADNFPAMTDGNREDYFLNDELSRIRGGYVAVRDAYTGAIHHTGFLGDGLNGTSSGCVMVSYPSYPATFRVDAYSRASANGHSVTVIDDDTQDWRILTALYVSIPSNPPGNRVNVDFSPSSSDQRAFSALLAATLAIYRHNMGTTGGSFRIAIDGATNVTTVGSNGWDAFIELTSGGARRKFTVAHEMGHAVLLYRTADSKVLGDCTRVNTQCPASDAAEDADDDDHSMASREYQSCAFAEGFAHFYATDAFNSHDSEQAAFNYYKDEFGLGMPVVDVEHGYVDNSQFGAFPDAFMESRACGTAWSGRGVELDWLRTFWDMHADGSTPISFSAITAWIDGASAWGDEDTFSKLDSAANAVGGSLNSTWDTYSSHNGIDH